MPAPRRQYIVELYNLAEHWRLKVGNDPRPSCSRHSGQKAVQLDPDLTLEVAKKKIRQREEHLRQMEKILMGLHGVLCHMDDVMIFGRTKEEHDGRLEIALRRIEAAGVTLKGRLQWQIACAFY